MWMDLYVAMLSKTLERYLSEPEIVEGSGFRHFVGNRVLRIHQAFIYVNLTIWHHLRKL